MSGFQRGDEVIYISKVPKLKRPCLLIGNKYCVQKIATFDSQEYADGFAKMLGEWFGAEAEVTE
jgi:hypothetical protein